MSLIYKHTFKSTNKSYISKSETTLNRRLSTRLTDTKNNSQTNFHRALRKYGKDNLISEILEDYISLLL